MSAQTSVASSHERVRPSSAPTGWQGWVLVAPFLLCFGVFSLWPLLNAARLATQQTYGPGFSRFVGLENFSQLLRDPMFWTALKNTSSFTLLSVRWDWRCCSIGLACAGGASCG